MKTNNIWNAVVYNIVFTQDKLPILAISFGDAI
jgi:hypothetical protein